MPSNVPAKAATRHDAGSKSTESPVCAPDTAITGITANKEAKTKDSASVINALTAAFFAFKNAIVNDVKAHTAAYNILYVNGAMSLFVIIYAKSNTEKVKRSSDKAVFIKTVANGVFFLDFI